MTRKNSTSPPGASGPFSFTGDTDGHLASAGAAVQRLLWASTSTKYPDYPDTLYIDELIGAETVNTIPPHTIDAFRDHGRVGSTLEKDIEDAYKTLDNLVELQIDLDEIVEQLQEDGVIAFADSFDALIETIEVKREKFSGS